MAALEEDALERRTRVSLINRRKRAGLLFCSGLVAFVGAAIGVIAGTGNSAVLSAPAVFDTVFRECSNFAESEGFAFEGLICGICEEIAGSCLHLAACNNTCTEWELSFATDSLLPKEDSCDPIDVPPLNFDGACPDGFYKTIPEITCAPGNDLQDIALFQDNCFFCTSPLGAHTYDDCLTTCEDENNCAGIVANPNNLNDCFGVSNNLLEFCNVTSIDATFCSKIVPEYQCFDAKVDFAEAEQRCSNLGGSIVSAFNDIEVIRLREACLASRNLDAAVGCWAEFGNPDECFYVSDASLDDVLVSQCESNRHFCCEFPTNAPTLSNGETPPPVTSQPTSFPTNNPTDSPTANPTLRPTLIVGPPGELDCNVIDPGSTGVVVTSDESQAQAAFDCAESANSCGCALGLFAIGNGVGADIIDFSGNPISFTSFAPGQPATTGFEFDCILLDPTQNFQWITHPCGSACANGEVHNTICQAVTDAPTVSPTKSPTTGRPTFNPTVFPTDSPSTSPTQFPTRSPVVTGIPTTSPTFNPTKFPTTAGQTDTPTNSPTLFPTRFPTDAPVALPTTAPTRKPTQFPTLSPTSSPTEFPTASPTIFPTGSPTDGPTTNPTSSPTASPSTSPTKLPTGNPTTSPTNNPTVSPSANPTTNPTFNPTSGPTASPSESPSANPTSSPSANPTINPTVNPTTSPTDGPTIFPTLNPTSKPTKSPSTFPTSNPTLNPTVAPSKNPTINPTLNPTVNPTTSPTDSPTANPTASPTSNPTVDPTVSPSTGPTTTPTRNPTIFPTLNPTTSPTNNPTKKPTSSPTSNPTINPTSTPTENPSKSPTAGPTLSPSSSPTTSPSANPTVNPTSSPTQSPSVNPTLNPTKKPTASPSTSPSINPTLAPTTGPTESPTKSPSKSPTLSPTENPTVFPTTNPTSKPTTSPSGNPTASPTENPTLGRTDTPTEAPSGSPTESPTKEPTKSPTISPTKKPTSSPTTNPTGNPTQFPTISSPVEGVCRFKNGEGVWAVFNDGNEIFDFHASYPQSGKSSYAYDVSIYPYCNTGSVNCPLQHFVVKPGKTKFLVAPSKAIDYFILERKCPGYGARKSNFDCIADEGIVTLPREKCKCQDHLIDADSFDYPVGVCSSEFFSNWGLFKGAVPFIRDATSFGNEATCASPEGKCLDLIGKIRNDNFHYTANLEKNRQLKGLTNFIDYHCTAQFKSAGSRRCGYNTFADAQAAEEAGCLEYLDSNVNKDNSIQVKFHRPNDDVLSIFTFFNRPSLQPYLDFSATGDVYDEDGAAYLSLFSEGQVLKRDGALEPIGNFFDDLNVVCCCVELFDHYVFDAVYHNQGSTGNGDNVPFEKSDITSILNKPPNNKFNTDFGSDVSTTTDSDSDKSGSDKSGTDKSGSDKSDADGSDSDKSDADGSDSDKSGTDKSDTDKSDTGTDKSATENSDSEKSDSEKSGSEKSDSEKSDSEKSDSEKSGSEKSDSEKSDSEKSGSDSDSSEGGGVLTPDQVYSLGLGGSAVFKFDSGFYFSLVIFESSILKCTQEKKGKLDCDFSKIDDNEDIMVEVSVDGINFEIVTPSVKAMDKWELYDVLNDFSDSESDSSDSLSGSGKLSGSDSDSGRGNKGSGSDSDSKSASDAGKSGSDSSDTDSKISSDKGKSDTSDSDSKSGSDSGSKSSSGSGSDSSENDASPGSDLGIAAPEGDRAIEDVKDYFEDNDRYQSYCRGSKKKGKFEVKAIRYVQIALPSTLACYKYVRITDNSLGSKDADDGFDLHAIKTTHVCCTDADNDEFFAEEQLVADAEYFQRFAVSQLVGAQATVSAQVAFVVAFIGAVVFVTTLIATRNKPGRGLETLGRESNAGEELEQGLPPKGEQKIRFTQSIRGPRSALASSEMNF